MAKTKSIGVRIENDLFSKAMRAVAPWGLNLSRLVEKLLLFFIRYPEEIIEFENRDPLNEEFVKLYKQPDWSLRLIQEKGILTKGQLYWLAELLQQAWHKAGSATAAWVLQVVIALQILVTKYDLKPETMNYLESSFPEEGQNLAEKIKKSLSFLQSSHRVESHYADAVAKCFLLLIREGGLDIAADVLSDINKLFMPWSIWVAKRALQKEPFLKEIDTSPLLNKKAFPEKSAVIKKIRVLVEVYFSDEGIGPFHAGQQPFSCGFTISDGKRTKVTFACISQTFYELIEAVAQLGENKEIARFGSWEIMRNSKEDYYSVRKDGVLVFLEKKEMEEFIESVRELYKREDVQQDLLKEYVEVYGAV